MNNNEVRKPRGAEWSSEPMNKLVSSRARREKGKDVCGSLYAPGALTNLAGGNVC